VHELERLFAIAAPRDPLLVIDWQAAEVARGVDLPADYKALAEHYGAGTVCDLSIYVPGHPSPYADLLRLVEVKRNMPRYLIESGIEQPCAPAQLLPWANDGSGNQLWWLMENGWPVVASEARGDDWERYDSAVTMLADLATGRLESEFLTIEDIGEGFRPDSSGSSSAWRRCWARGRAPSGDAPARRSDAQAGRNSGVVESGPAAGGVLDV
jgi:hypothetical protein